MTVETTARFLSELNEAFPRNKDLISEGDDHIRLIKQVMKNTFPGFNSSVAVTSTKMNKWNSTFTYNSDDLQINNNVILTQGKTFDAGGARLSNLGAPSTATDAVTLGFLQSSAAWPVGSIFLTVDLRNPNLILGYGVWEKFASGRMLMGSGSGMDTNANAMTFVSGSTGGEYAHQLSTEELPAHVHPLEGLEVKPAGLHYHNMQYAQGRGGSGGYGTDLRYTTEAEGHFSVDTSNAGEHTHDLLGTIGSTGEDNFHNNLPPYVVVNMWRRTS